MVASFFGLSAGFGPQSPLRCLLILTASYDGDIESSSTIGTPIHANYPHSHYHQRAPSPTPDSANTTGTATATAIGLLGRAPTPRAGAIGPASDEKGDRCVCGRPPKDVPVADSYALKNPYKHPVKPGQSAGPPRMYERPTELSIENIRAFVQRSIDGEGAEDGVDRWWRTSPPVEDRPVRIYADGVYDLFHFGHSLQLRQAKLSFPRVHLLVGVCSDQLCADNKSPPAMTHAERCEAVRQCRWVDEIIPDAPWAPDQAWVDKHRIDYIAHDEIVYPSKDHDDVYAFVKGQGESARGKMEGWWMMRSREVASVMAWRNLIWRLSWKKSPSLSVEGVASPGRSHPCISRRQAKKHEYLLVPPLPSVPGDPH